MLREGCRAQFPIVVLTVWQLAVGLLAQAQAQEISSPEANALFVSAVQEYRGILADKPDAGREELKSVRDPIFRILSEYPDSVPATELLEGPSPAGMDLVQVLLSPAAGVDAELNEGRRTLAQDLIGAYEGNLFYLAAVAEASRHAVMSWAAYGKEEALSLAAEIGCIPEPAFRADLLTIQSATATLFVCRDGRHVLAFPGTREIGAGGASDWFTNTVGTLTPLRLTADQVADSIEIAKRVSVRFPDVEFAGHSLGGRFAQLAALETGRPAYAFNSAPLGIAELNEIGWGLLFGTRTRANLGPILRFRGPDDPLTEHFSEGDPIIRNIQLLGEEPGDSNLAQLVQGNLEYVHGIETLARAMLEVTTARDEGWLVAYLREQDGTSEVSTQPDGLAWPATMTPHLELAPGQSRDGTSVGVNGDVTFRGVPVLPATPVPEDMNVHVYRSPATGHRLIVQRDLDYGGLRAAVVFDGEPPAFVASVVPDESVRGIGQAENVVILRDGVSWSHDGRYIAIQASRMEGEVSLLVINLATGEGALVHPDEGGRGGAVEIDKLQFGEGSEAGSLSASFRRSECDGSTCETHRTSINFDIAHAIRSNPWPTVRQATSNAHEEQEWGSDILAPEGSDVCPSENRAACLLEAGYSEAAIQFDARLGDLSPSYVRLFLEVGAVDFVEAHHVSGRAVYRLAVNGEPDIIHISGMDLHSPSAYSDALSYEVLASSPDPLPRSGSPHTSHRVLPDGGQRFVDSYYIVDGCMACDLLGIGIAQFDFDPTGKLVASEVVGLMDTRRRPPMRAPSPQALMTDSQLIQFMLNVRGYDAGPMDGTFGRRSLAALTTFQAEQCLPATGTMDPQTADRLAEADLFMPAPCVGAAAETATALALADQEGAELSEAGTSCRAIENDIARLECYDAVAKGETAESVQSQAAFGQPEVARLEALLTFGFFRATVDLEACTILVRDTRELQTSGDFASGGWSDWLGSTSNGFRTVGEQRDAVTFPLGSLDLRQTRPSESDGLSVVTESDALITRARESEDFATGRIRRESKTFRSYLLYTASPYDALPVYELLSAADLDCRKYGD
jgi:hypothetical protein